MSCHLCQLKDDYAKSLEAYIKALEIALENSRRSLAAEGRQVKKARRAVVEVKQQINPDAPKKLP